MADILNTNQSIDSGILVRIVSIKFPSIKQEKKLKISSCHLKETNLKEIGHLFLPMLTRSVALQGA